MFPDIFPDIDWSNIVLDMQQICIPNKSLNDLSSCDQTSRADASQAPSGGDGDDDPEYQRLKSALENALMNWLPAATELIKLLRESAADLDTNQKKTNIAGILGGAASLLGAGMALFPPTTPIGIAVSLGGNLA